MGEHKNEAERTVEATASSLGQTMGTAGQMVMNSQILDLF